MQGLIDFNHHLGCVIAETITSNLFEQSVLQLIKYTEPTFSRDGNQFCYLYGRDLQDGIYGFGETPWAAMVDFYNSFHKPFFRNYEKGQPSTEVKEGQSLEEFVENEKGKALDGYQEHSNNEKLAPMYSGMNLAYGVVLDKIRESKTD